MQWLLGGLAVVVQSIIAFFVSFISRKTAQIIIALTLSGTVTAALVYTIGTAISSIVVSAPTGFVASGIGLLPYNTAACIAAVITANLARWLYDWQLRVINYSVT